MLHTIHTIHTILYYTILYYSYYTMHAAAAPSKRKHVKAWGLLLLYITVTIIWICHCYYYVLLITIICYYYYYEYVGSRVKGFGAAWEADKTWIKQMHLHACTSAAHWEIGATYCTAEINTSEITVDFQWHFPMEFQWCFPTEMHYSVICSTKGLSLVQWICTGNFQWMLSGIVQWSFPFAIHGV